MTRPAWLDAAWAELGVHETPGRASNARILAFFRDAGHPEIGDDETAWCAAFVGACLARSGIKATGSLLARSYLAWGEPIDDFRPGAVAVFSRGSDQTQGHVGFIVDATKDRIRLLGGNQGNAVSVTTLDRASLLGVRWPKDHNATPRRQPVAPLPAMGGFDAALAHVLEMEGGFTDDPHDPGGPTNLGITLADFAAYKGQSITSGTACALTAELKSISLAAVREIYLTRYWNKARCADLTAPIAFMHFDTAVNQGVGTAARMLQQALAVGVDGEIGAETLAAATAANAKALLQSYAEIRRQRYRGLALFWRFGRGWLARVDTTLARALALADAPAPAAPITPRPQTAGDDTMTETPDTQQPAKWWGESVTIWGALITALATVLPTLGPLIGIDITAELVRQIGEQAVRVAQALAGLAGTATVIWGRTRASARLTRREVTLLL